MLTTPLAPINVTPAEFRVTSIVIINVDVNPPQITFERKHGLIMGDQRMVSEITNERVPFAEIMADSFTYTDADGVSRTVNGMDVYQFIKYIGDKADPFPPLAPVPAAPVST